MWLINKATTMSSRSSFPEVQRVIFPADTVGGGYSLSYDGQTTETIAVSGGLAGVAANLKQGLEALPNIGAGNIEVRNTPLRSGTDSNNFIFNVAFRGTLAETDVPPLTVTESRLLTTSGVRTITIEELAKGVRSDPDAFRLAFEPSDEYPNALTAEDGDRHPVTGNLLEAAVFQRSRRIRRRRFSAGKRRR